LLSQRTARLVTVNATRSVDGGWQVRIEGTSPAITLNSAPAETVGLEIPFPNDANCLRR